MFEVAVLILLLVVSALVLLQLGFVELVLELEVLLQLVALSDLSQLVDFFLVFEVFLILLLPLQFLVLLQLLAFIKELQVLLDVLDVLFFLELQLLPLLLLFPLLLKCQLLDFLPLARVFSDALHHALLFRFNLLLQEVRVLLYRMVLLRLPRLLALQLRLNLAQSKVMELFIQLHSRLRHRFVELLQLLVGRDVVTEQKLSVERLHVILLLEKLLPGL